MWTRRRTVIGGQTAPDDWNVLCHGRKCGRVMRVTLTNSDTPAAWQWSAWCYPTANGRCDTMEAALECVRQAVIAAGGRMSGSDPDIVL